MKTLNLLSLVFTLTLVACQSEQGGNDPLKVESGKTIIGKDDRKSTSSLNLTYEKGKVGLLISKTQIGNSDTFKTSTCTGALVSKNIIVTAAHCAFNDEGEALKNLYFIPGLKDKDTMPNSRFPVIKTYLPKAYVHGVIDSNSDFAYMELGALADGRHAGDIVGFLGLWGKDNFEDRTALTIGYPGDKDGGQYYQEGCNVTAEEDKELYVECDVFKGQSGSPILFYDKNYKNYYVEGVLSNEDSYANYGSRVTKERQSISRAIRDGKFVASNFNEQWIIIEHARTTRMNVMIKNACDTKDLYVAVHYKDTEGNWVVKGYFVVKPNKTQELIQSNNRYYYLHAQNANRTLTSTNVYKTMPNGKNENFQEYNAPKLMDQYVTFGCN